MDDEKYAIDGDLLAQSGATGPDLFKASDLMVTLKDAELNGHRVGIEHASGEGAVFELDNDQRNTRSVNWCAEQYCKELRDMKAPDPPPDMTKERMAFLWASCANGCDCPDWRRSFLGDCLSTHRVLCRDYVRLDGVTDPLTTRINGEVNHSRHKNTHCVMHMSIGGDCYQLGYAGYGRNCTMIIPISEMDD